MKADSFYLFKLAAQGYCCSQILLLLGLKARGQENPDLINAMAGLGGGLGGTGNNCGALTGGVCLLGFFAASNPPLEAENKRLNALIEQLTNWFKSEYKSLDCAQILADHQGDEADISAICAAIVMNVYQKVSQLLAGAEAYG